MPTRVVDVDQISINAVKYRVSGGITIDIGSVFPPKQVTGDYGKDSQPYSSVHTWSDWRDGIGVDRWGGPEDDKRTWYSECWTRNKGHLLLPPLVTATASGGVTSIARFPVVWNGGLYACTAATSREVKLYTPAAGVGAGSWGAVLFTLTATPATYGVTGFIGATEYMAWAYSTGYEVSSNGTSVTTSAKKADYLVFWDDKLWGVDITTGQLWYTITPGSAEVDDAKLPLNIDAFFVGPDATGEPIIYAVADNHLYAHDFANSKFIRTEIEVADDGGLERTPSAIAWQGNIYLTSGAGIIEYSPREGTARDIGLDVMDGVPATNNFYAVSLLGTPTALIVGTARVTDGEFAPLLAWDRRGWQILFVETADFSQHHLTIHNVGATRRLYFRGASAGTLRWLQLVPDVQNPKQVASYNYAASAIHKTPWFSAGQADVIKTLTEVRVDVLDVSATATVAVRIAYDYAEGASDASYLLLGTITTAGVTTYPIPNSTTPNGRDFRALRIKLTLTNTTITDSPDVGSVTVVYRKKLPTKYTISCKLDLSQEYGARSPKEMLAALNTAKELTNLVEVTFRDDTTESRNYYGDLIRAPSLEGSGLDERSVPDVVFQEI